MTARNWGPTGHFEQQGTGGSGCDVGDGNLDRLSAAFEGGKKAGNRKPKKEGGSGGRRNSALCKAPVMPAREVSKEIDLGKYRCGSLKHVYYIPTSSVEGETVVAEVEDHGKNKKPWVHLTQRRLQ